MLQADLILQEVEILIKSEGVGAAVVGEAVLDGAFQVQRLSHLPGQLLTVVTVIIL